MSLFDSLSKLSEQIQSQRQLITSEQAAKQVSVQPFIQALGYDLSNLNEVSPGYVGADGWSCDYAIVVDQATLVFDKSHHSASRVKFGGNTASPSNAALKAIHSIVPAFKAINGWTFWKLRDPNRNRERPISDLRNDNALVRRLQGNT